MTSRYQMHCATCFRVFEAATLEQVALLVSEHEAKRECRRPVYDDGEWK